MDLLIFAAIVGGCGFLGLLILWAIFHMARRHHKRGNPKP